MVELGQEKAKMSLEHLVAPISKEVPRAQNYMMGHSQGTQEPP